MFQVDSSIKPLVLTDLTLFSYQTAIIYANNIKDNCYKIQDLNYWNKNKKTVTNSLKRQILLNGMNSIIVPNNNQIIK